MGMSSKSRPVPAIDTPAIPPITYDSIGGLPKMARIKSFSKEQGFGYIEDPEHGDVLFDFEACNFPPEEGDEVEIVELGKRRDGSPKAKRVICPAKPPPK